MSRQILSSDPGNPRLFWVAQGSAVLHHARQRTDLSAGQAVWVGTEGRYEIQAEAASLCLPIATPARHLIARTRQPLVLRVPTGWQDWLVHQFTMAISPLRPTGTTWPGLSDLLHLGGAPDVVLPLPRTELRHPEGPPLTTITDTLRDDPALPHTAADWARRCGLSQRTLQRHFLAELGLTLRQWRTACRLLVAATHLRAGDDPHLVAHQVGFTTTHGFHRAFTAEFGLTPDAYAALARPPRASAAASPRPVAPAPPPIPASATPWLVNNFHVIIWMYRGDAQAHIDTCTYRLGPGDAIWLPAGIPNRVETNTGSIMVPLQSSPPPTRLHPDSPRVFDLRDSDETDLLRCAVGQYTPLRPRDYQPLAGWTAFEDWVTGDPAPPTSADPTPPQPAMRSARRLIDDGLPISTVATRLGYAHLSSFSRAFTRAHGLPPRTYQRTGGTRPAPPPTRELP